VGKRDGGSRGWEDEHGSEDKDICTYVGKSEVGGWRQKRHVRMMMAKYYLFTKIITHHQIDGNDNSAMTTEIAAMTTATATATDDDNDDDGNETMTMMIKMTAATVMMTMMSTATENGDNGNCDGDGKGNGDGNGGEEEDSDGNDDDGDGDIKIDNMVRRTNQKVMAT